jgi:hypothetical protein
MGTGGAHARDDEGALTDGGDCWMLKRVLTPFSCQVVYSELKWTYSALRSLVQ